MPSRTGNGGPHLRACGLCGCHAFLRRIPRRDGSRFPYHADQTSSAFTGNFEVGVHIADVSYFVPEGSPLDKVAAERATSVYLVQKVSTSPQSPGLRLILLSLLPLFLLSLKKKKKQKTIRNSHLIQASFLTSNEVFKKNGFLWKSACPLQLRVFLPCSRRATLRRHQGRTQVLI